MSNKKAPEGETTQGLWQDLLGLSRLWPYLRADKRAVTIALLLIPAVSLFQTLIPLCLRHAIDDGMMKGDQSQLLVYAALFGGAVLLEYLTRAGQSIATAVAVHRMIRTMRAKLFTHVLRLKAAYHDRTMSGALTTRTTSDFDNLSESLNMGVLTLVVDLAVLLGLLTGMMILSWQLTLSTLIVLPLVGGIVQWFSKALKKAMLAARVKIAALNAYTQECLYGHVTVKILVGEKHAAQRFDRFNIEYRDAQMSSVILDALMFAVLDGIASITVGLVLWVVAARLGVVPHGDAKVQAISAGVVVAFVQYIQQIFDPLKNLGNKMAMLQGAFSSLDRIFGVFATEEFIKGSRVLPRIQGHVAFRHVSFWYREDREPVLRDVSFEIEPGHSLAIVGATGSGKSTMIKLLSKLYDGYQGDILIDGHELRDLSAQDLRRQMAIVPQDLVLFDGTIAFNIGMDLPGVTQEDIQKAAAQVGAHEFISRLPGGYDFAIREQGANLSHGQRQLLVFARALARDPGLIILDEATSSVDPESEAVVQRAIQHLFKGRTVVVIAHRLSTIRQCNQIIVVDKGQILETGDHETLLKEKGVYFRLHTAFATEGPHL